ncbi:MULTISPECIES: phosphotriesterase family protein [unclassified Streptomyces]|uniref:phosphotriesterase family protein n=1 Tax=unclassified Streptomyces TaxID=2593676 RepID=UPI000DADEAB2|nr:MULTISPECIES: aryldialkylphosphatase [unclassified Streptomyces]PZT77574.1 aryldialkylphosphatase [Streptomyces sp. AC1-42W]PZT78472.1 aryldialkylphosphatase [Streptomyces sp. AC1-42T]
MSRYPFEIPDLSGRALTVAGPVDPAALGATLMHEHLFVDLRRPPRFHRPGEDSPEATEPLSLANLARTRHGHPNADNDVLDDHDEMLAEVLAFAHTGGGTVVEVSPAGLGRDPEALLRLSRASGLNIVMGGGWYTPAFHPADMDELTVDELADAAVRDIVVGVDGTGIRSGVIGEVGADSVPLSDNELKSVRASGRASRVTGAPVTFHVGGVGEDKFRVLDILAEEGVPPSNIVLGHAMEVAADPDFGRRVLDRGVFVEFDFLTSPGSPWGHLFLTSDHKVARGIAELVERGHAGQILLGHDVCQKIQLKKYGGQGYDYIPRHFLPALRRLGVSESALHTIMVDNPARALAFAAPR